MDADSPWAPYVEEICLQSTRVTACLLNRGGEVLSHRGQIPASCFTALRDGPFALGGVCKFGIHASAVKAVSVDTMGITKVTFAAHVQAFYGFDFILSTMIEPSESPHDENVVCDPVVANCLSLCTALAEYLQRTAPVILAYPTPTPSTTRKKSVVKTPARIALPPSAASDGWAALAQATLQRNQQMHEYIICSPDCQSVYHATPGAMFLKTVGMVVQEDGTEIEQVIDEAVNMSTCLVKKVFERPPSPKTQMSEHLCT